MSKPDHCPECGCLLDDPADHSEPARRRYFAILREAHRNLPDHWRELCPTAEHLRKWCLVKTGYCDVGTINCGSQRAANEVALLAKRIDGFVVTLVTGPLVSVYTARSQSKRNQPRKQFLACAEQVYSELGRMLGVDPAELRRQAA